METIELDPHKKLVFKEECFLYLREDVLSEEFRETAFYYRDLKKIKITYTYTEPYWFLGFLGLIGSLFAYSDPFSGFYGTEELTMFFTDGKRRELDIGKSDTKRKKEIRDVIIFQWGKWLEDQEE